MTCRMFASVANLNNQGGGSKKCMCGWKPSTDGTSIGLIGLNNQHRKSVSLTKTKNPRIGRNHHAFNESSGFIYKFFYCDLKVFDYPLLIKFVDALNMSLHAAM